MQCPVQCRLQCECRAQSAVEGCVEPEEVIVVNLFGDQGHFWWVQQELLTAQLETDKIKMEVDNAGWHNKSEEERVQEEERRRRKNYQGSNTDMSHKHSYQL